MNNDTNLVVPFAQSITPVVDAAQKFQSLSISGVLFLVIIILCGVLFYKSKYNEKIQTLSTSINELVNVSKSTVDLLQQLNSSNNALVMQKIDIMNSTLEKIESNLREFEKSWYNNNYK